MSYPVFLAALEGCWVANVCAASRNFDEAVRVMQRATTVPKNTKVNYHDDVSLPLRLLLGNVE